MKIRIFDASQGLYMNSYASDGHVFAFEIRGNIFDSGQRNGWGLTGGAYVCHPNAFHID